MSAACPAFGFTVRLAFSDRAGPDTREECVRAFHAMLDARGLTYRGGEDFVMIQSEASQATDADRVAVRDWCDARPEIAAVEVGALVDLRDG